MPDDLLQAVHTYLTKIFTYLLGEERKEIHDIFCPALKVLAQLGVLSSHPHRAGISVALAHHHTPQNYQRQRAK